MRRGTFLQHTALLTAALSGVFGFGWQAARAESTPKEIRSLDPDGSKRQVMVFKQQDLRRGAEIVTADTDGDGQLEIFATPTYRSSPTIYRFDLAGTLLHSFSALDGKFSGGLNLAAGDIDADGRDEIIVAARSGGGPVVQVYEGDGTQRASFLAYENAFRGGVDVAAGDLDGDGVDEIATISGFQSPGHLRVFEGDGTATATSVFPLGVDHTGGASLAVANVDDASPYDEMIVGPLSNAEPRIRVLSNRGTALSHFLAFSSSNMSGVTIATDNADDDALDEIYVVRRSAAPLLRTFDGNGFRVRSRYTFSKDFRGDLSLAGDGAGTVMLAVTKRRASGRTDLPKYIEIDLSEQRMRLYRNGVKIAEHMVSTGKWSMPTPQGEFATRNKIRTAYSRAYDLYMDYWMAITPDGAYGIHSLPFWKLRDGGRLYEGTNHLGTPVSHGCIRLHPDAARDVYAWADVGTTVIVNE